MDNSIISFDEIKDWRVFQSLVAAYFKEMKGEPGTGIESVKVMKTGDGSDGGRDILVTFDVNDSIISYKRKWVIQCKFHDKTIGKKLISEVNIPTLIHEYGANGYLLVCKSQVHANVSSAFEQLNNNCKFGYSYQYWEGTDFLSRLLPKPKLHEKFFPKYKLYVDQMEKQNIV